MFFIEGYVYDNPCDQGEQSPTKYGQRSIGSFEHGRLIQSIVDLLDVLGEEQAFLLDKSNTSTLINQILPEVASHSIERDWPQPSGQRECRV